MSALATASSLALLVALPLPAMAAGATALRAASGGPSNAKVIAGGRHADPSSLAQRLPQLGATYGEGGVRFDGSGFGFSVGNPSLVRSGRTELTSPRLLHGARGATYQAKQMAETFRPTEAGIEQSFLISERLPGRGGLSIELPVSGLTPRASSNTVDLLNRSGRIVATYSGLHVTDASGRVLPSALQTHDSSITITINESRAEYPLSVDPTWSQVAELTSSGGAQGDQFGSAVAVSGSTAIIGAPDKTVNTNAYQGEAYIYQLSNGTWSQTASLTASDGSASSYFGDAVAIDGNLAFIGAPNALSNEGKFYVFALNAGTWSQVAEFTGATGTNLGRSLTEANGTLVVGAPGQGGGFSPGTAFVYSGTGSNWTQAAQLNPSDGGSGDSFGGSVAISGGTIVVGSTGHTVSGNTNEGSVYVFSGSGSSWTQTGEIHGTDSAAGDVFGIGVALWRSTLVVGARFHTVNSQANEGAAYIFTQSGGTFAQTSELTASDGASGDQFGTSVAISGAMAFVGSPLHAVNGNAQQGAAYVFAPNGSTWSQTAEITASDGVAYNNFGRVAMSGFTGMVGVPARVVGTNNAQGATYVFNLPLEVQPQGSAISADQWAGGSPSEACQCSGMGGASQTSVGDPVDPATGDLHETATDLSLPGSGLPLGFNRTYDAQAAQSQAAAGTPAPALGYGWSYNLGMSLAYNPTSQEATVTEENGAQVTFTPYVSGSSPAWCTAATNYCSTAPRVEATLNKNADGNSTYVRYVGGHQLTFTFSSGGALVSEADQFGNTLTSSAYSPGTGQTACPVGDNCTAWTSSSSGRELALAFNSAGRLVSSFDANSTLSATFGYSGTGCTTWNNNQTPDLCQAVDPGGLTYTFTYDAGNASASLDYDMLTLTPPASSAPTSNAYDSSGRLTQQTDPSGAVTSLSYSGTNSSLLGGATTVTDYPLGTGTGKPQDITNFEYSSNVLVETAKSPGTSTASTQIFERDPVSLLPLVKQDGNGNMASSSYQTYSGTGSSPVSSANLLTSSDPAGNTIEHAYNQSNQTWCSVDAADYLNSVRCPSSAPSSPPAPGVSDPDPGATITFYNASGLVTASTDAVGNTTTYAYTSGISGVPNGLVYCTVDPVDYQKGVTCPAYGAAHVTGTTTNSYDSAGDKTSTTDADGNTTTFSFNAAGHPGMISSQTDPDGTTTTFSYNAASEVTTKAVTFGGYSATTLYAYDGFGRQFCQVDPYEAAQSVTCPSSPPTTPPTPASDPYIGATITTYDANGRVVQVTNPIGGITYSAYDQAGELFCTVRPYEAAQSVTCPSSPPSSPPTIGSDPYLGATITTYDADGRVVQVTNPLGGITLTAYDAAGNVVQTTVESNSATSAPNVVTAYTYDPDNRAASTTVGYASSTPATTLDSYDPNGNVFCSVSANASAAGSSAYQCPQWQPGWITAPPSPASLYSTTPTSSQANNVSTVFYNADGAQVQTTNPDIETNISVVDGDGRTYCASDPVNVSTWLSGHSGGSYPYLCPSTPPSTPPATGSNPGYVTNIFDAAGRDMSTTDQSGDTTSSSYDPAGQRLTVTDPGGKITTNCYYHQNGSGQCAASAPAGGGSADDLYSTTTPATSADPSGQTTTYTYYAGDEPNAVTSPAGKTTDTYDANLDLTSVAYSNTAGGYSTPANVSYTYYKDGTRHTMVDGTGTTTYTEDAIGDVTQQQLSATGTGLKSNTVSYSYFTTGAQASVSYPSYGSYSAPAANYTYDSLGSLASVSDWLSNKVTFSHDGDGNLTSQRNAVSSTNPNGTSSTAFSYDNADQNSQTASTLNCSGSNGTLTHYFSGTNGARNLDNQITQDQEVYASPCSGTTYQRNYSYDMAGRVLYQGTTAQGANPNTFAYDASGDPTTISSHDPSSNFDTYTQVFDSAGEVNSQTPISGSQGVTSTYTYDTLGDRTQTLTGSTTTSYGFNQAGQMTSAAGSNTTTYQYTGTGLEAATTAPGIGWGSPSAIDGTKVINSVSCANTTLCFAVDANGNAITYSGTWGTASSIDGTKVINSVSCANTTLCFAVDANGNAVKYSGTWGTASSIDGTTSITSVSCPSTSFCEAVDAAGNALKYNGSSWTSSLIDRHKVLEAVSCQSSTFCEAVDNAGNVLKYNGTSWSTSNVDSTRTLKSVSCPTTTFCAAVDANGNALTYNGTSWSSATDIDGTAALNGISCTSATFCQVVDAAGNTTSYNGTTWTPPANIDNTTALDAVSCASSSFCQAADAAGNALPYGSMNITSQLTWDTKGALPAILSDSSYDYIYGPNGTPVEQINLGTSTPTYLTYTPSDSTWLSTNAAGNQTGFWGYDASRTPAFGTPTSPFGYSGQYSDTTTGLVNDRARFYSGQTGSFTTRDPAFAATDTAYTYAGGDPVNRSDPTGRFDLCVGLVVPLYCSGPGQPPAPPAGPFTHVKALGIHLQVDSEFAYALDSAIYGGLPTWQVLVAEMPQINSNPQVIGDLQNTLDTVEGNDTTIGVDDPATFTAAVLSYISYWPLDQAFNNFHNEGSDDLAYFVYRTTGLESLANLYNDAVDFSKSAEFQGLPQINATMFYKLWKLQKISDFSVYSGGGSCEAV